MSKLTPAGSDKSLQTHSFPHAVADEQNWAWQLSVTSSHLDFESLCLPLSKVKEPPTAGCVLRVNPGLGQKVARAMGSGSDHVAHLHMLQGKCERFFFFFSFIEA